MKEFKDNKGETWRVQVNVRTMRRIKAKLGKIPGSDGEQPDVVEMLDALYAVCETDSITQDEFDERLDGVLGTALSALGSEIENFSQRQGLE